MDFAETMELIGKRKRNTEKLPVSYVLRMAFTVYHAMPFQIGAATVGVWGGWDPSMDVHVIQDPTFWKALRHLPNHLHLDQLTAD